MGLPRDFFAAVPSPRGKVSLVCGLGLGQCEWLGEEVVAGTRCRGSGRALRDVIFWDVGAHLQGTWVKFSCNAHGWWVLGSGLILGFLCVWTCSALAERAILGKGVAHATSPQVGGEFS